MDPSISFEQALKRLEEIVKELERGEIEIEQALTLFEEGTKLARICASKLSKVERRVEILKKGKDGDDVLELFEGLQDQEGADYKE